MRNDTAKSQSQSFAEQLAHLITSPGTGARMTGASSASSHAGGSTGEAELITRQAPDGRTQKEWMIGDPWTSDYFFKEPPKDS